jgi:uncharacterized protein YdhG (YjbR/CyaY superfamily)
MENRKFKTVDEYIATFPKHIQVLLAEIRKTIKAAAPQAQEVISYNMPAYKQNGVLVYFAGYEKHIGFYPTSSPIKVFKEEIKDYKTSKGAIQFSIEGGIPKTLVKDIVKYRIKEDQEKSLSRPTAKSKK